MPDISVIIPAYNAEEFVGACLDSVLGQTKKEIEIVVINDGSKDNTLDVLNDYSRRFPEIIKVISQENQGLSCTRNNGIKASTGKYIFFLDSDDYLKPNALELLYNKAVDSNCDVSVCGVDCVYPDRVLTVPSGATEDVSALTLGQKKKLLLDMYVVACNKLYKRSLFENPQISFEPGIWFEDVLFFHKVLPEIGSIACVHEALYEYVQRENSITYTYSDKLYDLHTVVNKIVEHYKENGLFVDYKDEIEFAYVRYMLATFIKRLAKSKDKKRFSEGVRFALDDVKKAFPEYKKNPYLNNGSLKGLYLKLFNPLIAKLIFIKEKNQMN